MTEGDRGGGQRVEAEGGDGEVFPQRVLALEQA
ncbi:MAG: hypothetical protein AVDCRST_MAG91-1762, partial [uncultured Sphingomonadaceae bacterium]